MFFWNKFPFSLRLYTLPTEIASLSTLFSSQNDIFKDLSSTRKYHIFLIKITWKRISEYEKNLSALLSHFSWAINLKKKKKNKHKWIISNDYIEVYCHLPAHWVNMFLMWMHRKWSHKKIAKLICQNGTQWISITVFNDFVGIDAMRCDAIWKNELYLIYLVNVSRVEIKFWLKQLHAWRTSYHFASTITIVTWHEMKTNR